MAASKVRRYTDALDMVELIETRLIHANKFRMRADLGDVDALAASIGENGLIQPILVRPASDAFEIVAGHRRFAACKKLKWLTVPCIVNDLGDKDAFELSLVENVLRETLDPIDEARAFTRYVEDHGWGSVSELARRIKKSEEYVSHRLMLLSLPKAVQEEVSQKQLTCSSAYELHLVSNPRHQEELAKEVIRRNLSVRETREAAHLANEGFYRFEKDYMWSNNQVLEEDNTNDRVYAQTLLTLKMCMIRLDALLGNTKKTAATSDVRMIRLTIHSLIDKCMNAKRLARTQNIQESRLKSP